MADFTAQPPPVMWARPVGYALPTGLLSTDDAQILDTDDLWINATNHPLGLTVSVAFLPVLTARAVSAFEAQPPASFIAGEGDPNG